MRIASRHSGSDAHINTGYLSAIIFEHPVNNIHSIAVIFSYEPDLKRHRSNLLLLSSRFF